MPLFQTLPRTPKVYLSSRFQRQEEMIGYATEIESLTDSQGGTPFRITSRWLNFPSDISKIQAAYFDQYDVAHSDIVICFSEDLSSGLAIDQNTGGRHVELGMALAFSKMVLLIGPRENVFHHLPEVQQFDTFELALKYLKILWFISDPGEQP